VQRGEAKGCRRQGGKELKARGLLQVLTINTLGPDEEDVRRGCVSHDMEPQGADSSTTETLQPAFGPLARLTLAAFILCWLADPLPSPPIPPYRQASLTLRHYTFSRRAVRVRLIFSPCLIRSAITLGIIRHGWMVEREGIA